jgi:DNA-binding NarL/FixJ family response regulator
MRAVRQFVHIHSELDVNRVRILSLESIGSAASNPIELSPSGPKRRKIDTESSESIPVAQESPSIASSKSFPESVNPLPALPKDQQQIFDLFQSGLSISEMCSRRCIRRSTVESTLAHLIQLGFPIEWPRLGVSDQTYAAISKLLASFTTAQVVRLNISQHLVSISFFLLAG